jgi:uncharacterized membrane protein
MSQPPDYPGTPADPQRGNQTPPGYPPPPGYGTPPPPPPGYGAPPPAPGYSRHASPPPGPPGGYGPPPGEGPPPGYGTPPSYATPPPQGYGQAPSGGIQFSAGDAFNWAWNKFTKNAAALIVPMLIYGAAMVVLSIVVWLALMAILGGMATSTSGTDGDTSGGAAAGIGFFGFFIVPALFGFVVFLAAFYIEGAFISGCLDIADGKPVSITSFLRPPRNFGSVILAALLVALGTAAGYVICILPGIIFLFFSMFTIPFVIDRSLSPIDALKASFSTINKNLGSALLAYLVTVAVAMVGGVVLFVGTFISVPVSLLIMTYTYRRLTGGQIAPQTLDGPAQPYQPPYQPPQQQPPYQPPQPPSSYQG